MIALGLVLLLLIIFVAQNTQKVNVSFLGWDGQTPLAVALLIAAAAGLFIAADGRLAADPAAAPAREARRLLLTATRDAAYVVADR